MYSSRMSAEAQVRGYSDAYQRRFRSRQEAEQWLGSTSGYAYPFFESLVSRTPTHRIEPRSAAPDNDAVYLLRCDGASRGNPGASGCCACIWLPRDNDYRCNIRMASYQHDCGYGTNNVAEFRGLIGGLILALGLGIKYIRVEMDSQLVVNQSYGLWQTVNPTLSYYKDFTQSLLHEFDWWQLDHISRDYNSEADAMANDAIDNQMDGIVCLEGYTIKDVQTDWVSRVKSRFQQYHLTANVEWFC